MQDVLKSDYLIADDGTYWVPAIEKKRSSSCCAILPLLDVPVAAVRRIDRLRALALCDCMGM